MSGKIITDKEYQHVSKTWNKFEIITMKVYHDLYFMIYLKNLEIDQQKFMVSVQVII